MEGKCVVLRTGGDQFLEKRGGYKMDKKRFLIGLVLIVASLIIGHGVGQMISDLTGKSVVGSSEIIGLGIGLLAFAYTMMRKK